VYQNIVDFQPIANEFTHATSVITQHHCRTTWSGDAVETDAIRTGRLLGWSCAGDESCSGF